MKRYKLLLPPFVAITQITKAQNLPNAGFENWTNTSYNVLDSNWYSSNAASIASTGTMHEGGNIVDVSILIPGMDIVKTQKIEQESLQMH